MNNVFEVLDKYTMNTSRTDSDEIEVRKETKMRQR